MLEYWNSGGFGDIHVAEDGYGDDITNFLIRLDDNKVGDGDVGVVIRVSLKKQIKNFNVQFLKHFLHIFCLLLIVLFNIDFEFFFTPGCFREYCFSNHIEMHQKLLFALRHLFKTW